MSSQIKFQLEEQGVTFKTQLSARCLDKACPDTNFVSNIIKHFILIFLNSCIIFNVINRKQLTEVLFINSS